MKRLTLISALIIFSITYSIGCSCAGVYFCDYLNGEPDREKLFIKGKVLSHVEYSENNIAVYIEVYKKFRDDVGVTDTIKLFGSIYEAGCQINPYRFKVNSEIYLGMEVGTGFDITDPDEEGDRYWSFGMVLCSTVTLGIENDVVRGRISEKDLIFEYPLELFESKLENCEYSNEELNKIRCSIGEYTVFPNPSNGEKIRFRNNNTFIGSGIREINVYTIDGRLKNHLEFREAPFQQIDLTIDDSGIYVLEVLCGEEKHYKKVIVKK